MKFSKNILLFSTSICLLMQCCDPKESNTPDTPNATTYDSTGNNSNITNEKILKSEYISLVSEIKKARLSSNTLTKTTINNLFTTRIKSSLLSYYKSEVEKYIPEMVKASGNTYSYGIDTTGNGGVYGEGSSAYLFDEKGLEFEQIIDKGMFAALLYNEMIQYFAKNNLTSAECDKLLTLYGANPTFPNTPTADKTAVPDVFIANYAARRSDINDNNSIYNQLKNSFIQLKNLSKESTKNSDEIEKEKTAIRKNIEKVIAATVINYLYAIESHLQKYKDHEEDSTQLLPTINQTAAAMHAFGECVGFIHGFKSINSEFKTITESDIDYILSQLRNSSYETHSTYLINKLYNDGLVRVGLVKSRLKTIYAFSEAEMESFKTNWVSAQKR